MKKLMIAAAVAAMGAGVFAECAEDPTPAPCAFAYKVTLSGKTIATKTVKTTVPVVGGNCIEKSTVCMAVPGTFKRWGYVYGKGEESGAEETCDAGCGCNDFTSLEAYEVNKKAKTLSMWDFAITRVDVIGTKQNQVQVYGVVEGIRLAGQGKLKKGTISSVKGTFTGEIQPPTCSTCEYDESICEDTCDNTPVQVGQLCDPTLTDATAAVVFGKWTMKASKAVAKKLAKNYNPQVLAKGYKVYGDN